MRILFTAKISQYDATTYIRAPRIYTIGNVVAGHVTHDFRTGVGHIIIHFRHTARAETLLSVCSQHVYARECQEYPVSHLLFQYDSGDYPVGWRKSDQSWVPIMVRSCQQ